MKKATTTALCAGWLVLIAVGGRGIIWPSFLSARELDADIAQKQAALARPGSGPEVIERLARDLAVLKSFGDERMTPIPEDVGVASMVSDLSAVLDGEGLQDRELTTGAPKQLDEAKALPMTILIRGEFPPILSAVSKIESMTRLVRVQRLRVSQESPASKPTLGADRSGRVKAEILLDVFFAPKAVQHADAAKSDGGTAR